MEQHLGVRCTTSKMIMKRSRGKVTIPLALLIYFSSWHHVPTFRSVEVAKTLAFQYVSVKTTRPEERSSSSLPTSNTLYNDRDLSTKEKHSTRREKVTFRQVSVFDCNEVEPVEDNKITVRRGLISNVLNSEGFQWVLGSLFVATLSVAFLRSPLSYDSLLGSYKASMVKNPLQTKVATGATLAVLGDALAQMREPGAYSKQRAVSFALFDSCYRMFQHVAFPTVVRLCQGRLLGGIVASIIPKSLSSGSGLIQLFAAMERTMMYQLGVVPLFYYPVFFTFTGLLQGLSLKQTFERGKVNFFPCWRRNLIFWIPIQMIMFGLIDEKWQIPFVCIMGMAWSTILSVTAGKAKK